MLRQSITLNSLLLGVFAVVTTGLIAGTYLLTRDTIVLEQRKAEERALLEIVPKTRHNNAMLDDTLTVAPDSGGLGLREPAQVYIARQDTLAVAAIIPVLARDGYSGDIGLIVGVNADGSVAGVRVLNHRETPGLGDKIELAKSPWMLEFNGRSLQQPQSPQWAVQKDGGVFDQFTGATITPRAVVAATHRALQYADANHQRLFSAQSPVELAPGKSAGGEGSAANSTPADRKEEP